MPLNWSSLKWSRNARGWLAWQAPATTCCAATAATSGAPQRSATCPPARKRCTNGRAEVSPTQARDQRPSSSTKAGSGHTEKLIRCADFVRLFVLLLFLGQRSEELSEVLGVQRYKDRKSSSEHCVESHRLIVLSILFCRFCFCFYRFVFCFYRFVSAQAALLDELAGQHGAFLRACDFKRF